MKQTLIHGAKHSGESQSVALQYSTFNLAVTKKLWVMEKNYLHI
jgi:hypothetical protein